MFLSGSPQYSDVFTFVFGWRQLATARVGGAVGGRRGRAAGRSSASLLGAHTRRLRLLQVVTDTDRRGAQVFATDLHGALASLGHEVQTVALCAGRSGGLDVDVLGPTRRSLTTHRRLRHESTDVDVVIAHGSTTLPVSAIALAGTSTPFVYRQISDTAFWAPDRFRQTWVRIAMGRAAAAAARAPPQLSMPSVLSAS